ncbi:MAG: hypothetical protein ACI9A7_002466 [Cyclobacteriaceae bacterium]|jgi:hypothetical protein
MSSLKVNGKESDDPFFNKKISEYGGIQFNGDVNTIL